MRSQLHLRNKWGTRASENVVLDSKYQLIFIEDGGSCKQYHISCHSRYHRISTPYSLPTMFPNISIGWNKTLKFLQSEGTNCWGLDGEGRHTSPCGRLTLQKIHWILSQTLATLLQIRPTWTNAFLEEIWRVQTLGGGGWETSWTLRCFTCSVCQKMLRLVLALGCGNWGVGGLWILHLIQTGHWTPSLYLDPNKSEISKQACLIKTRTKIPFHFTLYFSFCVHLHTTFWIKILHTKH